MPPKKKEQIVCCPDFFHLLGKKVLWTLCGIFVAYSIVFLGTLIRNNLKEFNHIGKSETKERTIVISGQGKITAVPDIAMTTIGFQAEAKTVTEAQLENTKVMNNLIDRLKVLEIDEKDIQTKNYNVYPMYDYLEEKGRILRGYQVSQNIEVKIRDLKKANTVFALAGEVGANQVGGLNFTIDDRDEYIAQAREEAIESIGEKARVLSETLPIAFGDIVSYDEYEGGGAAPQYKFYEEAVTAYGGREPNIEAGSMEVTLQVSIVFEIL
jgi:uncharacterized protein